MIIDFKSCPDILYGLFKHRKTEATAIGLFVPYAKNEENDPTSVFVKIYGGDMQIHAVAYLYDSVEEFNENWEYDGSKTASVIAVKASTYEELLGRCEAQDKMIESYAKDLEDYATELEHELVKMQIGRKRPTFPDDWRRCE